MYRCCLVYSFYWLWEWSETFSSRLLEWMVSWYAAKLFLKKIYNISGHSVKDVMIIMWSIGHASDKRINLEDTKRFIQKYPMWISSTVLFDNCKSLRFSSISLSLAYLYNWIGHECITKQTIYKFSFSVLIVRRNQKSSQQYHNLLHIFIYNRKRLQTPLEV